MKLTDSVDDEKVQLEKNVSLIYTMYVKRESEMFLL